MSKSIEWIYKKSKDKAGGILLLCLAGMSNSALGVVFALGLRKIVNIAVSGVGQEFLKAALQLCGVIVLQLVIRYFIRYQEEKLKSEIDNSLKLSVWEKTVTRSFTALSDYHTGELVNRMSSDVKTVTDGIVSILPGALSMFTGLVCAVGVLLSLDLRFGLLFLAGGLCVTGISYLFRRYMKSLHKQVQTAEGRVQSFHQEMLENLLIMRAYRMEKQVSEESADRMKTHKSYRMERNRFHNLAQTGISVIMNGGYVAGIIWCSSGILNGSITYGTLIAIQQLIGQVQRPFLNMSGLIPQYYGMTASAERLIELEELEPDLLENSHKPDREERLRMIKDYQILRMSNVTSSYGKGKDTVLEHTGFSLEKGDVAALTGESGIGKSTTLKLLLALYPCQTGQIELIDIQGKSYVVDGNLRFLFAYVPQGNYLYSGTIREIVSSHDTEKYKESMTVEEACMVACADTFINQLPKKYETRLGEHGTGLSEGQLQRLAMARAVYSNRPILLLDECTSALDEVTETRLLMNLKNLKDRTVLIVTHRKAALAICNRRIEIRDKKYAEV